MTIKGDITPDGTQNSIPSYVVMNDNAEFMDKLIPSRENAFLFNKHLPG